MTSAPLVDYYNPPRVNFDKINPLIRSAYNTTFDFEEYKQKLLSKADNIDQHGNSSFLNSIEEIRREQRVRLTQVEDDYYNQKKTPAFDVPYYAQEEEQKQETIIISKPTIPTASRRSPSPVFVTEERTQHHIYHHPISANIVGRHNDDIALSPHRTCTDNTITTPNVNDLTTSHIENRIENMWNEFELEDYMEQKK
jgi:hypothetical protein